MPRAAKQPATPTEAPTSRATAKVAGEAYDPGVGVATSVSLPMIPPSEPFLLGYHPTRWGIINRKCVPHLATFPLARGLNGGKLIGPAKYNYRAVAARHEDKGWTILDPAEHGYLRRVQVVGGYAYLTPWETAVRGQDRTLSDLDGYTAWMESLFADGHLPTPEAWQLDGLRERCEAEVGKLAEALGSTDNPRAKANLEARHTAALAALDAVIARQAACPEVEIHEADMVDGEAVSLD